MMSRVGDTWEKHQRREINRFLRQYAEAQNPDRACVPAYPGSMLFNQIAVLSACRNSSSALPRFESLDPVYESLSYTDSGYPADNSILLDCQVWRPDLEKILAAEFDQLVRSNGEVSRVVILSGPHRARLERLCKQLSLNTVVKNAPWWNGAAMLYLYRSVSHVLFVDTARSLDAAMIGVECTMIASHEYSQSPVSSVLFSALSQLPCCRLRQQLAHAHETTEYEILDHISANLTIVENSAAAVVSVLGVDCTESSDATVIRAGGFRQQRWKNRLGNLHVSTRRKVRKLTEDPHAFFADSRLPGSNAIAARLPVRTEKKPLSVAGPENETATDVNKRAA